MVLSKAIALSALALFNTAIWAASIPESRDVNIMKRDNVNLSPPPLCKGCQDFPDDPGNANLCLCYNENYNTCTCKLMIADPSSKDSGDHTDKMNSCFSNRGGGKGWAGFSNDKISSMSLTGGVQMQCGFYGSSDCMGKPILTESSANGKQYIPNLPAGDNDKISSFYCTYPTARTRSLLHVCPPNRYSSNRCNPSLGITTKHSSKPFPPLSKNYTIVPLPTCNLPDSPSVQAVREGAATYLD
ncbi:MAG: hypothetical protein Q9227_002334 [Pyrenula ochraceoflavens]